MDEIIITDKQVKEKVLSLSEPAYFALMRLRRGCLNRYTAALARRSTAEEKENMDWIGYVGGIPDDEVPTEVWQKRTEDAIELVINWLNEEP
jgi:hypothetical protein